MIEIFNLLAINLMASTATQEGYGPDVTPPKPPEGDLPFTGVEAGLILAAGIVLAITGYFLRRTNRDRA